MFTLLWFEAIINITKTKARRAMEKVNEMVEVMDLDKNIRLEDIPGIDLYMDQVIQLFENTFSGSKRNEDDKILTKTMINNYAKGKLFFPVKNKKYSKEHIILISLIYQLKGALSIGEIKAVLDDVNEKTAKEDFDLEKFYAGYLSLYDKNSASFKKEVLERAKEASAEVAGLGEAESDSHSLETVLLAASLVNISNTYRRAAQHLIDTLKP
jgi:DNA-binding transcriptional MerR regulator